MDAFFHSLFSGPVSSIVDFAVRLAGSNLPYAGRVEVRYAGLWGIICPRNMSGTVLKVICRQLGFTDVMGDEKIYRTKDAYWHIRNIYGEEYGPVGLSSVRCHGNESSLSHCQIDNPRETICHGEALELMCRPRNFTPRELFC